MRARSLGINAESSPEHILATGEPGLVEAWNSLDGHLRSGVEDRRDRTPVRASWRFPADPRVCRCRELPVGRRRDHVFRRRASHRVQLVPGTRPGHRTSPWARAVLKLHSIESATARYNQFAAGEFDRINDRDLGGWIDEQGQMHKHPIPENPYRTKTSVR